MFTKEFWTCRERPRQAAAPTITLCWASSHRHPLLTSSCLTGVLRDHSKNLTWARLHWSSAGSTKMIFQAWSNWVISSDLCLTVFRNGRVEGVCLCLVATQLAKDVSCMKYMKLTQMRTDESCQSKQSYYFLWVAIWLEPSTKLKGIPLCIHFCYCCV